MKTSHSFTRDAVRRARFATIGFFLWTLVVIYFVPIYSVQSWPLVLFYGLLLINTFFSIRVFATLTPKNNIRQYILDTLLSIVIVLLPFFFNIPFVFALLCTSLFIVATLKYISLVPLVGFSQLLYKKIKVDTLGILLCFLFLIGVICNLTYISSIIFFIIFLIANVIVLWHKPLYRLENHFE